jgi:hypothetical protein
MIRYDPNERGFGELIVYSACYWVEHFGVISEGPLRPRLESIEDLCRAGTTRLHNWIKQNCRPDCTVQHRFVFDRSFYDPPSITSLCGSETILQHML